jgi:hypothetical protein
MAKGAEMSQTVVFFTTNDCNSTMRIKDADLDYGCSSDVKNNPKDGWQSWQVWDLCMDKPGCDLSE